MQNVYLPETPNGGAGGLLTQSEVIGMVNELSEPRDVVVCAAGSMPGDLHKLWRTRDAKGYHVEYGYSCMGYEVAGGLGVRLACPDRDVFVMVGDGSYLMMATELATAVQEGIKIITVLVQNHGYASIGSLSESLGSQRFGTKYRYRNPKSGRLDGDLLPLDLAANAASFGLEVIKTSTAAEFGDAIKAAKASDDPVVIYVETDPLISAPDSRVVVGRPGQRHLDPGVHPVRPHGLRRAQSHPEAFPVTDTALEGEFVVKDHPGHRPGLVGRLVPQRSGAGLGGPVPRRGGRGGLRVDRTGTVRLPAQRPGGAAGQARRPRFAGAWPAPCSSTCTGRIPGTPSGPRSPRSPR